MIRKPCSKEAETAEDLRAFLILNPASLHHWLWKRLLNYKTHKKMIDQRENGEFYSSRDKEKVSAEYDLSRGFKGVGDRKPYRKEVEWEQMALDKAMEDKLHKKLLFIKCFEPFDFTEKYGQLSVVITYTDGDRQTLVTRSTKDGVSSVYAFNNEGEYFKFIDFIKRNDIPRNTTLKPTGY